MKITSLPVGKSQTYCYIVYNEETNQGLIVDPGDQASRIIEVLKEQHIQPVAILVTHGDTDQVMASDQVQRTFGIPLFIHDDDKDLLDIIPSVSSFASGDYDRLSVPSNVKSIDEGEYQFAGFDIKVMHTSGHTKGSVSYYFKDFNVVFSGDVVQNSDKQSRAGLSLSSMIKFISSIKRILDLPPETMIYASHSDPVTVEDARIKWGSLLKY